MPIPLPNLDTRRYADLVDEALRRIPALHPRWTDHNPSDPGITLVELFAWLTEAVIYRTDQIPDETYVVMLRLLRGPGWSMPADTDLQEAIRDTISHLRARYRAVTAEDYEELVAEELADHPVTPVARVKCVPERSLDPYLGDTPAPGHVSVVVVPKPAYADAPAELLEQVRAYLHPRRLLTTRLQVVGPTYLEVHVQATLEIKHGFEPSTVAQRAAASLNQHFHPFTGGRNGTGWPFGRDVYVSEVHALLDEVQGVDFVRQLGLSADPAPLRSFFNDEGELVGVRVLPHELVHVSASESDFSVA